MRTPEGIASASGDSAAPAGGGRGVAGEIAGESPGYDDRFGAQLTHATVMMVDDEPGTMRIVQIFLEEAGYRNFVITSDPTRTIGLLREKSPDVLLLDLNMPEVDGFQILKQMRSHSDLMYIPVIVLTSSTDAETKLQSLELGATDFLAKPVDPSELVLRLRNTLSAKAHQDRLAYYDVLTGLPNRRLFLDRSERALRDWHSTGGIGAILHIDLDRFKQINDTLGPKVGDRVLKGVSQRLIGGIRASDAVARTQRENSRQTLSRLGGDEFTILLPRIERAEQAANVARRIVEAMAAPFQLDDHEIFITPSIGIALFPDDGEGLDTLLKHADIAMYHAKEQGGNTYRYYSDEINVRSTERLTLESQLRKALEREEFELYYQPKVNTLTGQITGTEALIRWNHSELGLVLPDRFIWLAEETGLIVPIGEWVLNEACRQTRAWQEAGYGRLHIAVNVSGVQFRQPNLIEVVHNALETSGLDPACLTLEMTESMIMDKAKQNIEALHKIKEVGLDLSIDDFGTGYSCLSYLTKFPLDELKVDRAFVNQIQNEDDATGAIVTAVIAMADSLGLRVVAEGVETVAQLAFLKRLSCAQYQGYLFSRPLPAGELEALLGARLS